MKKFKLLFSLLSFCFAIGVLCFGVYAASTVNYSIGGTINYTLSDVFVKVESQVYLAKQANVAGDNLDEMISEIAGGTFTNVSAKVAGANESFSDTVMSYTESAGVVTGISNAGATQSATKTLSELAFGKYDATNNSNESYTYFVVLKVTNRGTEAIKATITTRNAKQTNVAQDDSGSVVVQPNNNNDSFGYLVMGLALEDVTVSVTSGTAYSYVVSIAKDIPATNITVVEGSDGGEVVDDVAKMVYIAFDDVETYITIYELSNYSNAQASVNKARIRFMYGRTTEIPSIGVARGFSVSITKGGNGLTFTQNNYEMYTEWITISATTNIVITGNYSGTYSG